MCKPFAMTKKSAVAWLNDGELAAGHLHDVAAGRRDDQPVLGRPRAGRSGLQDLRAGVQRLALLVRQYLQRVR